MPRIRTIKPEFWQNEGLCSLPREVRALAAALLNVADDDGYFRSAPALVAGAVFPFDLDGQEFVAAGLKRLARIGFVRLFEGGIGQLPKFGEHQRISHRTPSKLSAKALKELPIEKDSAPYPENSGGRAESSGKVAREGEGEGEVEVEVEREVEQGTEPQTSGSVGQLGSEQASAPAGKRRRGPSPAEAWFNAFVEPERIRKLAEQSGQDESEIGSLRDTEGITPVLINSFAAQLRETTGLPLDRDAGGEGFTGLTVTELWWDYLEDPKRAGTKTTPYSFRYFVTKGVVLELLKNRQTESAA